MSAQLGLIAPNNTNLNVDTSYFVKKDEPISEPVLIAPVSIQGNIAEGPLAVPAVINVPGPAHSTAAYVGAMKLIPGGNTAAPDGSNGVVIRAAAGPATVVEVGTDSEGPNKLLIAGASGLSQVNDPVYNPAIGTAGNIWNLTDFAGGSRSSDAFAVDKTGQYMLRWELRLGENPVLGAADAGCEVFMTQSATVVPFSGTTFTNFGVYLPILAGGGADYIDYSGMLLVTLTEGLEYNYRFTPTASTATPGSVWTSLGSGGYFKVDVIKVC